MLDAILNAIFEQRIPPGTKLREEALASIFGVSRTRIRRILWALSHRRVVELRPNKGAVVARPSAEDARDVFAARQAVEALIFAACGGADRSGGPRAVASPSPG